MRVTGIHLSLNGCQILEVTEGEPSQQDILTSESQTVADFGGLCGYKDTTIRERQSAPKEKRQSAIQDITDARLLSQNLG